MTTNIPIRVIERAAELAAETRTSKAVVFVSFLSGWLDSEHPDLSAALDSIAQNELEARVSA